MEDSEAEWIVLNEADSRTGLPVESWLSNVKVDARKRESTCVRIDNVHLAGIRAWLEAVGRKLELKESGAPIGGVDHRALNDGCFEDLHFSTIKGQARPQVWCSTFERRLIDLVIEVQLLVTANDMREVRHQLDALASQRIGCLGSNGLLQLSAEDD